MEPPQRLSANPNPVERGGTLTVCYDFPSDGPDSVTVHLDWNPDIPGGPYVVTRSEPCCSVTVPNTAISLVVKASGSADLAVTIS